MKKIRRNNRAFIKQMMTQKCFLCTTSSSEIVFDDSDFVVVLDSFPAVAGHVMCAPKNHAKSLTELSEMQAKKLILLVRKIDRAFRKIFNPFRVAIVSSGLALEHFHVHIIPVPNEEMMYDFKFLRKDHTLKYTKKEREKLISKIGKELGR